MKRFLLAIVAACALHADVPSVVAIRNARVVPVSAPVIPRGTVLMRNGLIEAVGRLASGGIFAGQGAVIDLAGENGGDMVVAAPAGQYVTLASSGFGGGYPGSLMGTIAYIRQIYLDAEHYQKAKAEYAKNPRGNPRPPYDRALEGVLESPRVLIPVTRRIDIDRMLRFAAELKLKPVLYGAVEGYRSADLLEGKSVPVLINFKWPEKGRNPDPEELDTMAGLNNRASAPS